MNTAQLSIVLPDPKIAQAVHAALAPECDEGPEGSSVVMTVDGATLHAEIDAKDLSTLRAALNSVVRLLDAAQRTVA